MESPRRSPEHEAVLRCTDVLVTAVQHCIGQFTSECLSKGLISDEVEAYTFTNNTVTEKARKLVSAVRHGIKTDPSRFSILIDVLKEFLHLESEVEILQNRYSSLCSACHHFSPRVSSSSFEKDTSTHRTLSSSALTQKSSIGDTHLSTSSSSPENYGPVFDSTEPSGPSDESAMEIEGSTEERPGIIPKVVEYIKDLKNVRAFGLLLKIDPGKLDEIEKCSSIISSRIVLIVEEWFRYPMSDADRWEELCRVLLEPAVDEPTRACKLKPYLRRGSSVDSAISVFSGRSSSLSSPTSPPPYYQIPYIESIGKKTEDCSISNVLNCIAPYSEWYEIGLYLNLPGSKLDEIRRYPIPDQKPHFVELWDRLQGGGFSWIRLQEALTQLLAGRGSGVLVSNGMGSTQPQVVSATTPEESLYTSYWNNQIESTTPYEHQELEEKLEELQVTFANIQEDIMNALELKGVKFKQFKRAISTFPAHVQMNSFESIKTVSARNVELEDIFSSWNQDLIWSFLDFTLLERIVKKYGSSELNNSMKEYSSRLKDFRKRTIVSRLMCIWLDPNPPKEYERCKTLIHNLNIKADECTLEKLELLRKRSCDKLLKGIPLSEAALVLFRLKLGCISLTWIVRIDWVQNIREALVQCVIDGEYFKENDIISLELDGEVFMTMERSLMLASVEGDVKKVDQILDRWNHKNHDVNATDAKGKTALILAAEKGHESVVCSLLETGDEIDINYRTEDTQCSALFVAYKEGHEGVKKLLLEYGADINLRDRDGKLAADLMKGWARNRKKAFMDKGKALLKLAKRFSPLKTKLLSLCEIGDIKGVRHFLEGAGTVDVDVRDVSHKEWTPLMWVCENEHYELVKLLLQHGASIHLEATNGWTALHIACSNNFVRITNLLLRSGAYPNRVIDQSLHYTPLMYISDMDYMEPMARTLLKHGADVEMAAAENGWTPLIQACHYGKEELVKLYLDHGAEVNRRAARGWTAMMAAARKDRGGIVKLLIEKEASMEMRMTDAKKVTGESAIHIASYKGCASVVPVLIECGADPNVTNKAGLSPLMIAANQKNIDIVEALCQSKTIDVNLQQKSTGLTALFLAAKNGHVEVFKKLLEYGAADEVDISGRIVNVRDVVRLFKNSRKAITKHLEEHKQVVQQRKQRSEVERVQKRSEVDMVQLEMEKLESLDVGLPAERPTEDHVSVAKEEMQEVKHLDPLASEPLTTELEPPIVIEEVSSSLYQDITSVVSVEKENETEEESATGDVVAPALEQLCLGAPKHEEPATTDQLHRTPETTHTKHETMDPSPAMNLHTESATEIDQNDEPSLDESGAKDSRSETSSLYEAEEVCDETPGQPGGKSITEARITKQESSQAEKDRFILNRFDLFAVSWKHTLYLFSGESHEYSGKGMKPVQDIYHAHTEQTV